MLLSKRSRAILYAYKKGYRVTSDGEVLGLRKDKLSLSLSKHGYLYFCVHPVIGEKRDKSLVYAHRLQAYQKFGDKLFEEGIQVRHLNNDKTDNSLDNIGIGTPSENMKDSPYVAERIKKQSLEAGLINSPLTEKDVIKIREKVKSGNYSTYEKLAEKYGLKSKGTISDIINRKTWTHV